MGEVSRLAVAVVVFVIVVIVSILVVARVPGAVVRSERIPAWTVRVELVDQALADGNLSRAQLEWREAYADAMSSGRWEALVGVGDAAVRVNTMAGQRSGHRTEARQAYLAALLRARVQGSAAGAERVAEAFAALGDEEMSRQARAIAVRLS